MAQLHPSLPLSSSFSLGARREQDVLNILKTGLPQEYDLFHNLNWSSIIDGTQQIGEIDIAVVSPNGDLTLLEVKSGDLIESGAQLLKKYANVVKNVGQQVRRLHASVLDRIKQGRLPKIQTQTLLVLPDHQIVCDTLAYPRERIIDSQQMPQLCERIVRDISRVNLNASEREQLIYFLSDRFQVMPDVKTQIGHVQQAYAHLSSGMAQWVPNISHQQGAYVIEATAGSGKTQLALRLLQDAARNKQRARYVCFNRPLADQIAQLAPSMTDVTTFDQLCLDQYRRNSKEPDFSDKTIYEEMHRFYLEHANQASQNIDLLIVDESQDMKPEWVEAMIQSLKPDGKLYVMGDQDQQLYGRTPFDLGEAVNIRCMDNFRSPRKIVEIINHFSLTQQPVQARSAYQGEIPNFYEYQSGHGSHIKALEKCLRELWASGVTPDQVAVISFQGHQKSEVLGQTSLAGHKVRKFTGTYDRAGNPIWSDGDLIVESIYRFKGQSAPVVVLCEVDFEELTLKEKCKLFVGFTRAQMRLEVVMSERVQEMLLKLIQ